MIADLTSPCQTPDLTRICEEHWRSVYNAIRRTGVSHQDGEDLTQDFFHWFISKDRLAQYTGNSEEISGFIRVLLKRFLINRWRHRTAVKRGGKQAHVSLETEVLAGREEGFAELATPSSLAEKKDLYDAMGEAYRALRERCERSGSNLQFESLCPYLIEGAPVVAGADLAQQLGMNHNALRTAVSRLRKLYRQMIVSLLPDEDLIMLPFTTCRQRAAS